VGERFAGPGKLMKAHFAKKNDQEEITIDWQVVLSALPKKVDLDRFKLCCPHAFFKDLDAEMKAFGKYIETVAAVSQWFLALKSGKAVDLRNPALKEWLSASQKGIEVGQKTYNVQEHLNFANELWQILSSTCVRHSRLVAGNLLAPLVGFVVALADDKATYETVFQAELLGTGQVELMDADHISLCSVVRDLCVPLWGKGDVGKLTLNATPEKGSKKVAAKIAPEVALLAPSMFALGKHLVALDVCKDAKTQVDKIKEVAKTHLGNAVESLGTAASFFSQSGITKDSPLGKIICDILSKSALELVVVAKGAIARYLTEASTLKRSEIFAKAETWNVVQPAKRTSTKAKGEESKGTDAVGDPNDFSYLFRCITDGSFPTNVAAFKPIVNSDAGKTLYLATCHCTV